MKRCHGCGEWVGKCSGHSAIYSSGGALLCDFCWIAEDELIEEVGTNDPDRSREIAALLARYRRAA
jgi:hypothetical protein